MTMLKIQVSGQDHSQGPEHAPITLVEYGDYECPHCGRAYPVVKQLQRQFGDRVRFVFRNFPLAELHPHAVEAAEAAEFAGANGAFWQMHGVLFENQRRLSHKLLLALTQELGLPAEAFERAWEWRTFEARVRGDFNGGVQSGVNGTPTFFINGQRHDGAFDLEAMVAAIERAS